MALDAGNHSPPSSQSYFQKTVTLLDWWLTKPQPNAHTLGVAGLTSQQNRAARCFSSAPILKIYDLFELETVDGVCVILQGFINKDRTLQNGFSSEVFDHFVIGFPPNWKNFSTNCLKRESAVECVTRVQEEDGKDSTEGHGDVHGKAQNCDSYTVDMGVQDCKDTMLSNTTITPLNPPSVEIAREHIIEAGNEVLRDRSHMTTGFEDDPSLKNIVDSSTGAKCLGVSSRRMTRSMKKMAGSQTSFLVVKDISNLDKGTRIDPGILNTSESLRKDINDVQSSKKKAVDVIDCDTKSKSRNIIINLFGECGKGSSENASCSEDTVLRMKSKQSFDQNVDVTTKATRNSNSSVGINKDDAEVNESVVLTRTNMKGCRNRKKNIVNVPPKEGVPATQGINSRETIVTPNKSKTKLPVKRKLITSPISAKSTTSRNKKGSEEKNGSSNIVPLKTFSGKKSRSGRVVLPPLEFWRNQKVVYDEAGDMCGVQEP
ncbi:hypothetical protein QVD17_09750 [Tagetes erecta]|uniref:SANTA domain-containing protein n=1 Tax=Tagetes erecta TaxID=13708 RepID=A0AAD8L4F1_TARER|nr:hypothetical protein QVD17_09750 [Tagetes erecta]